jgi:hypothetical protein
MSKKTNQKLYDLFVASGSLKDQLKRQALTKKEYAARMRKINNQMFCWLTVAGIEDLARSVFKD